MSTLKEVQKLELSILDKVIDVIDSLNLTYFAAYGTLLGAVRNGGFIPWDTDIDIWMPRRDYNLLLENKDIFKSPLFLQNPDTDTICNSITKIRCDGTSALSDYFKDVSFHRGVFIDIFPLDSIYDDENLNCQLFETIDFIFNKVKYDKDPIVRYPDEKMIKANAHMFDFLNDTLTIIDNNTKESGLCGSVADWRYLPRDRKTFYKKDFENHIYLKFDGLNHKISVPIGYKNILNKLYGDWTVPKKDVKINGDLYFDLEKDYRYYDELSKDEFLVAFDRIKNE